MFDGTKVYSKLFCPDNKLRSEPETGCSVPTSTGTPEPFLFVPTTEKPPTRVSPLYSEPNFKVTAVPAGIVSFHSKICEVVPIPKSPIPVVIVENV
ncbi:hypothetical protein D3C86_1216190 [compost metagenome]